MKDDLRKPMLAKKPQAVSASSISGSQELTCSEGQIDDLFAQGETTESEAENDDTDEAPDQAPASSADRKSPPRSKSGL